MAADPPHPEWLARLPPSSWSYGVSRDGRIFFINEEAKSTTWLHPVTGEAVITGHRKTPDLPTGWEEGYTFEGARCFINHNERKVTCKHPVTGVPSQDNCIFVVNEHVSSPKLIRPDLPIEAVARVAPKTPSEQDSTGDNRKDRPTSTMSEASNYTGGSDYSTFPASPDTTQNTTLNTTLNTTQNTTTTTTTPGGSARPSRSSKKIHNFGKRSNSIKRNPNAPAVRSNWLYKQDSTGMKLWKKRWFVLCDMCLFYYRDDKEEGILGSILLPSFHISMLSVDDHISKKYAFKATHPNMRTYYFCTDSAKDMETWMKAMTDAALVHSEPIRRLDKLKVDPRSPPDHHHNHVLNHRSLTRPEIHNNERNREAGVVRHHSMSRVDDRSHHQHHHHQHHHHHRSISTKEEHLQEDRPSRLLHRSVSTKEEHLQEDRHGDGGGNNHHRSGRPREREYYTLQRDGERYVLHKGGERYALHKDTVGFSLQKGDPGISADTRDASAHAHAVHRGEPESPSSPPPPQTPTDEKYAPAKARDGEKYLLARDGERYTLRRGPGDRHALQRESLTSPPPPGGREVRRQLSLRETGDRYGTATLGGVHVMDRYGGLKEVKKYATLREGDRYAAAAYRGEVDKYATLRDVSGERYGFHRDPGGPERPLTKINSIKLQPAQASAISAIVSASRQNQAAIATQQMNGPEPPADLVSPVELDGSVGRVLTQEAERGLTREAEWGLTREAERGLTREAERGHTREAEWGLTQETERGLTREADWGLTREAERGLTREAERGMTREAGMSRTGSMQQLEHWVRTHNPTRGPEEDSRSVNSYQTLPRNMPSHRCPPVAPRYPDGYRTLPRNAYGGGGMRPGSVASAAGSLYERSLDSEKRRSMRDDTMWQLYEWQQRQAYSRQSLALPPSGHYGTLPGTKTMVNLSEHAGLTHSIPPSPSHGSLTLYATYARHHGGRKTPSILPSPTEATPPSVVRGDGTLDRRQRAHLAKYGFPVDRHSLPIGLQPQPITAQSLQGKTVSPEGYTDASPAPQPHTEDVDIDTKLSRLCEQDKTVRMQEDKLQQLHREKHTLETALLSASQELSEQGSGTANPSSTASLLQQRDVLQNGLLSTCRELTRVHTELERSWRDYDRLEVDVTQAKSSLLEQLEALGSPQTEPPSQRHVEIQKELWRIQDVMEALAKSQPQRSSHPVFPGSRPLSSLQKNEQNPDYRLYKSEPELTTVKEEGDEVTGEERDKTDSSGDRKEAVVSKAVPPYPVGIVPPRTKSPMSPPNSLHIASYVTLRKTKKPEPKSDRPWSTEAGGEREAGRTRMSVEEQLERMRRNQQAKRRENPSRSPSFNKDHPLGVLLRRASIEAGSADPGELEAALRQLALSGEQGRVEAGSPPAGEPEHTPAAATTIQWEALKDSRGEEDEEDKPESPDHESQRVVAWELSKGSQQVEMVKLPMFEEDTHTSTQNITTENCLLKDRHAPTSPPPPPEDEDEMASPAPAPLPPPAPQPRKRRDKPCSPAGEPTTPDLETRYSYDRLDPDDKKHNNNNNSMVAVQSFTLVTGDT